MAGIHRTRQLMKITTNLSTYKFAAWNPAALRLLSRDLVEPFLAAVLGRYAVCSCRDYHPHSTDSGHLR